MSKSASGLLDTLIKELETDLGIDANAPVPVKGSGNARASNNKKKNTRNDKKKDKETKPVGAVAVEGEDKEKEHSGEKKGKRNNRKDKKVKDEHKEAGDAAAEKKPAKKPAAAPAANDQAQITKLDIRVGQIVKVWKHEDSEKLYCEEIDVGEDAPRQIASGLAHHYTLEEMQDRRILVLCNLKARNLGGFRSAGMVMCAAVPLEDKKEKVVFVEPPADAKVGERITFEGLTGEPLTPTQLEKKKVLANLGDDMKTDDKCVAQWKGHAFLTSAGPCVAPGLTNAVIR